MALPRTQETLPDKQWGRPLKQLYAYLSDRFIEATTSHDKRGSFQKIACDQIVGPNAGSADPTDPKFVAPIMGNLILADAVDSFSRTFTAVNASERFDFAAAHGLATGDGPFEFVQGSGALPTGVSADTPYWVIVVDTDSIKVATTKANALAGTAVSISTDGTTHATRLFKRIVDRLPGTGTYAAGLIGAYSLPGCDSDYPKAGVVGMLMDGAQDADAIVLAHIDGSDPSAQTNARAAFGVSILNNHASTAVQYGLDLLCAASAHITTGVAFVISKALMRSPNNVCVLEGDGAPVNGTTGDNFAGAGSLYIDYTNANVYVNAGTITDSVWKLVTRAA